MSQNIRNDVKSPLIQEWKAFSSADEVLFYKKSTQSLESMSYSNGCEKFFKTIWYYLCGYTKNDDLLFQGMSKLVERSMNEIKKDSFTEKEDLTNFMETVKKVHDVTLRQRIESYKGNGEAVLSLAAQHLQNKVEQFLSGMNGSVSNSSNGQTPKTTLITQGPNAGQTPVIPKTIPQAPVLSATDGDEPMMTTSSKPKPPPPKLASMKSPEEIKEANIQKTQTDIATVKSLVAYLELVELQATKEYKEYKSAKDTVTMFEEKISDDTYKNVSLEKLEQAIIDIDKQLKESGTKATVSINQGGTSKEYSKQVAKETLRSWKQISDEIKANQSGLEKYRALREEKAKITITHEGMSVSCEDIDKRVREAQKILAKPIEDNAGKMDLKTQKSALGILENKLATLQGNAPLKKAQTVTQLKKPVSPDTLVKSQSAQQLQGGIAALAQSKAAEKKGAMPDIFKI